MYQHPLTRRRPEARQLGNHIDDRGAVDQGFGVELRTVAAGKPVAHRPLEVIVIPAAVAKDPVFEPGYQRLANAGGGREIHVGDGKRKQVGMAKAVGYIVPLGAVGAVAVDHAVEVINIAHEVSPSINRRHIWRGK
ncbi:hypothetical protein CDAIGKPJ_02863 [Aeromonas salmonicida]